MTASLASPARVLLYVSHSHTTHDARFIALACSSGWKVTHVRLDGPGPSDDAISYPDGCSVVNWKCPTSNGAIDIVAAETEFRDLLREVRPRLIHAGPLHSAGCLAVRSADVPVVAMSWAWDVLIEATKDPVSRERSTETLRGASKLIVDSEHIANICVSWGAKRRDTLVVPWGIDLADFSFTPRVAAADEIRVISTRAFEPIYSVDTLITAVSQLRTEPMPTASWSLLLVGDGSQRSALMDLAQSLHCDQDIDWRGQVAESELSGILTSSTLYVSTAMSDGTSISMLQAMAVGLPCIVADLPTNREWVHDASTGWLFAAGDPGSLAAALRRAVDARDSWENITRRARAQVEQRADWVRNNRKILDLYDDALRT